MRPHLSRVVALVAVGVAIATAVGIAAPRSRTATRERDRVIRLLRGGTLRTDAADALHHEADTSERLLAQVALVDAADGTLTGRSAPPGGAAMPATAPTVAPPGGDGLRPDSHPSHAHPTRLRPSHAGRAPPPHN